MCYYMLLPSMFSNHQRFWVLCLSCFQMDYFYRDGISSTLPQAWCVKDPELRMFDRFDVDGSGHLERHELMKVGKEQTVWHETWRSTLEKEKTSSEPSLLQWLGSILVFASACMTASKMRGACIFGWYFVCRRTWWWEVGVDPNDYVVDDIRYAIWYNHKSRSMIASFSISRHIICIIKHPNIFS